MSPILDKQPLIVIVGPTGVGKTVVSIDLARRFGGEIVSADSRYLYRGMDVGTAKPTFTERKGIPHHLVDVADPDEDWSLALYQREAYKAIDEILAKEKLPFLVGGTGQYIRSIIEGWQVPAQEPDYDLREALNHWADEIGTEALHRRLMIIDRDAAEKIDYRNVRRVIRALEVIFRTGERFSALRRKQQCHYDPVILGIDRPRDELFERIDQRIELMLKKGWIDEVRSLLNKGYRPEMPTLSAIGYGEIVQYLQNKILYDEAVALIKRNTRTFVRRQANWFKPDDPRITWFMAGDGLVDEMEFEIRRRLNE